MAAKIRGCKMIPIHQLTTECPVCHTSWKTMRESLYEPLNSPNLAIALTLINNCNVCAKHFELEIGRIREILQRRAGHLAGKLDNGGPS